MRYVVEAVWSRNSRLQHREVISKQRALKLAKVTGFKFTDGTVLHVSIRPCYPRERIVPVLGYSRIIHNAAAYNLEGFLDVMHPKL